MSLEALLLSSRRSSAGGYSRYRLYATAYASNWAIIMSELELLDVNGENVTQVAGKSTFASNSYSSAFGPQYLFDGIRGTYSGSGLKSWQSNAPAPQFAGIILPAPRKIVRYNIACPETVDIAGYYPSSWILQGSNDGSTWDDLHAVSGYTVWASKQLHTWDIPA